MEYVRARIIVEARDGIGWAEIPPHGDGLTLEEFAVRYLAPAYAAAKRYALDAQNQLNARTGG
jgi:hypothetical protein